MSSVSENTLFKPQQEQPSQSWKSYSLHFLFPSCRVKRLGGGGCNCGRIHFEDYTCLRWVVWRETCGGDDLDGGRRAAAFPRLLHSYQPTTQSLPARWSEIFYFFFYPFWQLWVLLLESFWQIQRYLTTTSSSLFRHGCSSCWGDVLSGDDIIINYLRVFFSVILWELLISLKDEKNCRGVSGYLTLYFSSSTLLEVEILSEVHCILQPVPLSILVLDCGEQIRLCEIMEKYIKRTHSMLCFLVSLTWHSSLKRT